MEVDDDPVELWDMKDPQKYDKATETKAVGACLQLQMYFLVSW